MNWDLLDALGSEDRRAVLARCRARRYHRDEVVFSAGVPGNAVHLVTEGTFAVQVSTPMGDIATLDVLGPGETTGEQALIGDESVRSATVVALEDAQTLQLLRSDFAALLSNHPDIQSALIRILDARLRRTSQALLEALYLPAEARVLSRLVRLGRIYAGHAAGSLPITQEQLATMAGTTRPTVNRVLRRAQAEGLVTLGRGRITVTDPDRLALLVG